MTPDELMAFMDQYGLFFLFGIVLLEYMNMPGFPAGIIFPVTGVWLSTSEVPFWLALLVSVIAALLGSLFLYWLGKKGGPPLLERLRKKRPSAAAKIDHYNAKLRDHANVTVFVAKLLPVVRTLIGLPAGAAEISIFNYMFFSGLGIIIWNGVLMLLGVFCGDFIFSIWFPEYR